MGTKKSAGGKSLPKNLQICSSCNRINHGDGRWSPMENTNLLPSSARVAYGLCLDCCENLYLNLPEMKSLLVDKTR